MASDFEKLLLEKTYDADEDLDEMIRQKTDPGDSEDPTTSLDEVLAANSTEDPTPGAIDQFGRSFANAATFGLADPASAFMNAVVRGTDDESFWEEYDRFRDLERDKTEYGMEENPIAGTSGEVLGFLAGPGKYAKGIGSAAGIGGAYSGARSEHDIGTPEWSQDVLYGAGGGAAGMGAGQLGGKLAGETIQKMAPTQLRGAARVSGTLPQAIAGHVRKTAQSAPFGLGKAYDATENTIVRNSPEWLADSFKAGGGLAGIATGKAPAAVRGRTLEKGLDNAADFVENFGKRTQNPQLDLFRSNAPGFATRATDALRQTGRGAATGTGMAIGQESGIGEAEAQNLENPDPGRPTQPQDVLEKLKGTRWERELTQAAAKSPEAFNARMYVLKKNPEFRNALRLNKLTE